MSEQNQEQQESGKVLKKFEGNFKKLVALLNGKSLITKRPKVGNEDVTTAMNELIKEEKENRLKEIKAAVKELITDKIAFDEFAANKKKELDKAIEDKQKEFNKKAEDVFSKISGIEQLESRYYSTLQSAGTGVDPEPDPK